MNRGELHSCGVVLSHVPADGSIASEHAVLNRARGDGLTVDQAHSAYTLLVLENVLQHGRDGGLHWVRRALGRAPPRPQRPSVTTVRWPSQRR